MVEVSNVFYKEVNTLISINPAFNADVAFVGDSDFWYWKNTVNYQNFVKGLNSVNLGISGSRAYDWLNYVDVLIKPFNPKKIVLNLGYNDVHHGFDGDGAFNNLKKLIGLIRIRFPNAKLYINSICHLEGNYRLTEEVVFNALLKSYVTTLSNAVYIDINDAFKNCVVNDFLLPNDVHYNEDGYKKYAKHLLSFIKN